MANEDKSAVDEFLGDLNQVKDDPFKPDETDPFGSEKPEVKEEKVEEKEEKPLPFHKDPKVQRFIEKELERRLPKVNTEQYIQNSKSEDSDEITDVLTRIIGNDTPEKLSAIKDFKRVILEREDKGAEKALKQFRDEQEEERQKDVRAQEELQQGFEDIEEAFDVDLTSNTPTAKKTKAEFVDFITRIAPKNDEGQVIAFPDLEASFETFQAQRKPAQPNRAKELASRSLTRSTDASASPQNTDKSWKAVDRLFERLNK